MPSQSKAIILLNLRVLVFWLSLKENESSETKIKIRNRKYAKKAAQKALFKQVEYLDSSK